MKKKCEEKKSLLNNYERKGFDLENDDGFI